jgi:methylmalonyl-CoA mutase N-terminal domain/subunit
MNKFEIDEPHFKDVLKVNDSIRIKQIESLQKVKNERSSNNVKESLNSIKIAIMGNDNVMPHIIKGVENYVTLGEIADVMRSVWGEYD